jgi:hypothetical protein
MDAPQPRMVLFFNREPIPRGVVILDAIKNLLLFTKKASEPSWTLAGFF